jgi:hypothetical protein
MPKAHTQKRTTPPPQDERPAERPALEPTARELAAQKVAAFGPNAQLDLHEAAAVLSVSPSTFERLMIPCIPWASRTRRWKYGTILESADQRQEKALRIEDKPRRRSQYA